MARKQLINLHSLTVKNPSTSTIQPSIAVGEIVVQAVKSAATIYTKVFDATSGTTADTAAYTFAEFIDKAQVVSLIENASSSISDRIDRLETRVSGIAETLEDVQASAATALQSIAATGANAYVSAVASEKDGGDGAWSQTVTVTANVAGDIDAVTSGDTKLADAYKVKQAIASEAQARADADNTLNNAITSVTRDFENAVSGIGVAQGSIKNYVDTQVSGAIASVYKVRGSVNTYEQLPTTGLTVGDVYNVVSACTVDGKWYPAGTNWVYTENGWDPLGGTFDLTPYAYNSALTAEAQARADADNAINAKIGTGFSSSSTVADAINEARTSADNSLKSVSATGANAYVSAVAGQVTGNAGEKTQEITVTANVAEDIEAESAAGKLADAYQVKTLINSATASTSNLADRVSTIEAEIGTGFSSSHTISSAVADLEATRLTNVNAAGDDYVSLTTSKTGTVETITLASDVATDLSSVSATGQLADAYVVKEYVDGEVTAITNDIDILEDKVDGLIAVVGSNTAFTTAHTITDALAELENDAVTEVTVDNTNENGVTATKSGNSVALNLDNIVIDCGEY